MVSLIVNGYLYYFQQTTEVTYGKTSNQFANPTSGTWLVLLLPTIKGRVTALEILKIHCRQIERYFKNMMHQ